MNGCRTCSVALEGNTDEDAWSAFDFAGGPSHAFLLEATRMSFGPELGTKLERCSGSWKNPPFCASLSMTRSPVSDSTALTIRWLLKAQVSKEMRECQEGHYRSCIKTRSFACLGFSMHEMSSTDLLPKSHGCSVGLYKIIAYLKIHRRRRDAVDHDCRSSI